MRIKQKAKTSFHEPDEFWFDDGYWQISIGDQYLVTTSKKLAAKVARLLNQKKKPKAKQHGIS